MDTANLGYVGQQAQIAVQMDERYKYEQMWKHPEYRVVAPGEGIALTFLSQAKPKAGALVIDYGAGTGRGAMMLALMGNVKVQMLDFASNCLDEEVAQALVTQSHALSFTQHDLTSPVPFASQYGYCTDVMEHIPPNQVDIVLGNILRASQHVFFQIACEDDVCGALIGQPLHLSVHDYAWWLAKLRAFDCAVHWSQDCTTHCMFYVTAWQDGTEFVNNGVLNTDESQLIANVRANIQGDWQLIEPYQANEEEVMILCGGPSLNDYVDEIKQLRANGVKLVTVNGTYNWALGHGLQVSAQIIVDGREFNKRFVEPVQDQCKYLIASQVDPAVLANLPKDRTYLWHTNVAAIKDLLDERYKIWYNTPGGSTVVLRAIPLLRMLGFKRFHMYGWDSCLVDEAHHGYSQPENDDAMIAAVTCGDRVFRCHPWMVSQAREFCDLVKFLGDEIELNIKGDGLIAYIVNTGASLAEQADKPFLT